MNKDLNSGFDKKNFFILFWVILICALSGCGGSGGGGDSGGNGSGSTPTVITWAKTYGGNEDDFAYSIQRTTDGGYIVAGTTYSFGSKGDFWVAKINEYGEIIWQKTYGGNEDDSAYSIQQTADGGFIITGQSISFGRPLGDIWILKLNSNGEIDWQKAYPEVSSSSSSSSSMAYCIKQTSDGGFIVAGTIDNDFWIFKLYSNGGMEWQKKYGGSGDDRAYSIEQTTDGGFIVVGGTSSFDAGNTDIWLLKLSINGSVEWQKTYGGTGYDIGRSVKETSDGGFIVTGETSSFGAGETDIWVLKLDGSGNIAWQKTYGGDDNDIAYAIQQTSDGGFVVAGETSSFGAGEKDFWILKLDVNGNILWQKAYGGSKDDMAYSICESSDGKYVVAGESSSFGAGNVDFWVLKLDENGNIGGGCSIFSGSSASISDTSIITPHDSSVTPVPANVTVTNTSITPQDSSAIISTQCSSS